MIKKTLKINGVERILILDKDETLAQVLRDHLLLTGCKIGCGEGHCGACFAPMFGFVTRSCILICIRYRLHGWHMDVHSAVSFHRDVLFQQKCFWTIIQVLPVRR